MKLDRSEKRSHRACPRHSKKTLDTPVHGLNIVGILATALVCRLEAMALDQFDGDLLRLFVAGNVRAGVFPYVTTIRKARQENNKSHTRHHSKDLTTHPVQATSSKPIYTRPPILQ